MSRPGLGSMSVEQLDPCLCTHIVYAFATIKDGHLMTTEEYDLNERVNASRWTDMVELGFIQKINSLKMNSPQLKTLLAVGGWVGFLILVQYV